MLATMQPQEVELVRQWFTLDQQAIPSSYTLRSKAGVEGWWPIFDRLQEILRIAAGKALTEPCRIQLYEISVTHDEILTGLLGVLESERSKCFVISRTISPQPDPADKMANKFFDVQDQGQGKVFDQDAASRLEQLRLQVCFCSVKNRYRSISAFDARFFARCSISSYNS